MKLVLVLVASGVLSSGAAGVDLITNGSFESGTNGWILNGGAARYQVTGVAESGANALRVFNRISFTNAPQQEVTAALAGAGSGVNWTTRLGVQVPVPTTVRVWLRVAADNGGVLITNRHLLAERVVFVTNNWLRLQGTRTVSWAGTVIDATFYTESGMKQELPGTAYPPTIFDSIAVRPDSDGDGLWDDEEIPIAGGGTGTDPLVRDTDEDGLPDGWEIEQGTLALVPDGLIDMDGDGSSNWEEFQAATGADDPLSFPGRPRMDGLSEETGAVLRYLAKLPSASSNRCIAGQHLTEIEKEWTNHVVGLEGLTGESPGVVSFSGEGVNAPMQMDLVVPRAMEAWSNGALVLVKWAIYNPWSVRQAGDPNPSGVDIPELLNPAPALLTNQVARSNYLAWRSDMADHLTTLRDAGVVVLFRPCSEVNGAWFWWGNRPRDRYVSLWRDLHDHFTFTRGLTNLLWVYEPDSLAHLVSGTSTSGTPIDYYYPGDDLADVVGHNFYDDDWVLGFDSDAVWRHYGKPFAVPQAGPRLKRDGDFDNLTYLNGVTNSIPRISFFCVWNSFVGGGPATNNIAITDNVNALALMTDPLIVTGAEVNWQYELPMALGVERVEGWGKRVNWKGGILQESSDLKVWQDVPGAARPYLHAGSGLGAGFWRVRK